MAAIPECKLSTYLAGKPATTLYWVYLGSKGVGYGDGTKIGRVYFDDIAPALEFVRKHPDCNASVETADFNKAQEPTRSDS